MIKNSSVWIKLNLFKSSYGPVYQVRMTDILFNDIALFHLMEFMESEGQRPVIEFWDGNFLAWRPKSRINFSQSIFGW